MSELFASDASEVPIDFREALQWLTRAAENGNAVAQFNLWNFYDNGKGMPADPVRALSWYKLAFDQGLVNAHYNISPRVRVDLADCLSSTLS